MLASSCKTIIKGSISIITSVALKTSSINNCARKGEVMQIHTRYSQGSVKFTHPFVPVQVKNIFSPLRCLNQHHLANHMLLIVFHFDVGDMKEVSYGCRYHQMTSIMLAGFYADTHAMFS
jgi:hypothetical protein